MMPPTRPPMIMVSSHENLDKAVLAVALAAALAAVLHISYSVVVVNGGGWSKKW